MNITPAQTRVLGVISTSIRERGHAPTLAEIQEALGFSSQTTAQDHVRNLERRGAIRIRRGVARGIEVLS